MPEMQELSLPHCPLQAPISALWELLRWALGRARYTLPAIGLALLEQAPALTLTLSSYTTNMAWLKWPIND